MSLKRCAFSKSSSLNRAEASLEPSLLRGLYGTQEEEDRGRPTVCRRILINPNSESRGPNSDAPPVEFCPAGDVAAASKETIVIRSADRKLVLLMLHAWYESLA